MDNLFQHPTLTGQNVSFASFNGAMNHQLRTISLGSVSWCSLSAPIGLSPDEPHFGLRKVVRSSVGAQLPTDATVGRPEKIARATR